MSCYSTKYMVRLNGRDYSTSVGSGDWDRIWHIVSAVLRYEYPEYDYSPPRNSEYDVHTFHGRKLDMDELVRRVPELSHGEGMIVVNKKLGVGA